ncbi:hypothetical protein LTS07_010513 [Exophiala sideris]|uniref:Mid2 domain-containing protein n=1 Tax=Exophiala sideris TaxID=1016849 RepID=A0ABR0IWU9_9EURO|nr:hypothetical protein LTS07_010513 [Exophiala sideris]KAK5025994.1 hypothetical protein LTR13_010151 [Exophiala sideris]KAK5050681.1 hypothetical protein LTR69_010537 [Exophiala sideris]KAK5177166.1 hypothetical protein LTR44_010294 [Eurotiomycetes sp. CCFEE 6388]
MRLPSSLTILLAALLARNVTASFLPDLLHSFDDLQDVRKRCANPCGYYGQLCCASNEVCYTDSNNQAQCGASSTTAVGATAGATAGGWQYYTTTYVQTDLKTVTETFSSYVATSTLGATNTLSCSYSLGETSCGNTCCLSGQYCESSGSCVSVGGGSSANSYYSSLYTVTTVITNTATATNTASAPLRPTSNSLITITSTGTVTASPTGTATTTQGFVTPVSSSGSIVYGQSTNSGGGLSGGAIAGIVIGVIIGIIILLLLCACWCAKGLIDGLLSIFGLGPRKRRTREEEVIYERHSHRDRRGGRTWFGQQRPSRTEVVEEKRTSGIGGIPTAGWLAAGVGSLALWLGLKRRNRRDDKSDVSYDSAYYTDYMYSSAESSSDRRTRRSGRSVSRSRSRR